MTAVIELCGAPQFCHRHLLTSQVTLSPLPCEVVENAIVASCIAAPIPTPSGQFFNGWKAGVYNSAGEVCELSLLDRHWTSITVAHAPNDIRPQDAHPMRGEAVYGGLLFDHFGHFLLESTNRLWWPLREGFKGPIIFQSTGTAISDHAARFFDLLGISDQIIIATKPLKCDRIIVPGRSFTIQKEIRREFQIPFLAAGLAAENHPMPAGLIPDSAGVYLSRTQYQFRRSNGETQLEDSFRQNGYNIVAMENLPLQSQILVARQHQSIAGIAGSAFHSMLFSDQPKNATYICGDLKINVNFFMIDQLMENNALYIYNDLENGVRNQRSYEADIDLNLPKIYKYLLDHQVMRAG